MEIFIKHFVRLARGKWACVKDATYAHPRGPFHVTEGSTFTTGTSIMGVDLAERLDEQYDKTTGAH